MGNPPPSQPPLRGASPVQRPLLLPSQSPHVLPVRLGVLPISLGVRVFLITEPPPLSNSYSPTGWAKSQQESHSAFASIGSALMEMCSSMTECSGVGIFEGPRHFLLAHRQPFQPSWTLTPTSSSSHKNFGSDAGISLPGRFASLQMLLILIQSV